MLKSQSKPHRTTVTSRNKALLRHQLHRAQPSTPSHKSIRALATNNADGDDEEFRARSQRRTQPRTRPQPSPQQSQTSQEDQPRQSQQPQQSAPSTTTPPEPPRDRLFKTNNNARLLEDVTVDTRLSASHVQQLGKLLQVPSIREKKRFMPLTLGSPDQSNENFYLPKVQFLYNPSSGAHPAMPFFLYPNPTIYPDDHEKALLAGKLYPRYSYNSDRDGLLEYIRGVYYLPQYGQQHLLSQGRIEYYKPVLLNERLQYVIQAGLPSHVEKHEKHRDRIELDDQGKLIGLRPHNHKNTYFTAVERSQIQTQTGELCVDYQVQHVFYNRINDILVTPLEQKKRQRLDMIFEQLQDKKVHDLLDDLRELTVRAEYQILPDGKYPAIVIAEQQAQDDDQKEKLIDKIEKLGGAPPMDIMYWDINHAQMKVSKGDVFDFLRMSSNNNKISFNPRYASFHGHDGTIIPMEYLATRALHEIIDFASKFCPEEPQIWRDIKHEAIVVQQEHMRDQILQDKRIRWQAYTKFRKNQKRIKQNQSYETVYREYQIKMDEKRAKLQQRKDGKSFGVLSTINETRKDFLDKDKDDDLPLPEEIAVSSDDEGRDIELDVFTYPEEITLNQSEIDFIQEQTKTPPWHTTFQQVRRFEFRSLTPVTFGENKRLSSHLPEKDLDDEYVTLNFYARLLDDQFDYNSYHHVLTGAQNQFELQLQKVRAGLMSDQDLDLGQMISFSDICRDRPLDLEVWFEIPTEYSEADYRKLKELQPDPRRRPTTGTRVWTGIITLDAPGSFHYMDLSEDQMKKMFAMRQGITISKS